jgi:hypothetical protein
MAKTNGPERKQPATVIPWWERMSREEIRSRIRREICSLIYSEENLKWLQEANSADTGKDSNLPSVNDS